MRLLQTFLVLLIGALIGCAPANFGKEEGPQAASNGPVQPPPDSEDPEDPSPENPSPPPPGCPGETPDPQGCMVAVCKGFGGDLRVELQWCYNINANSNGLQKGDSHPDDPERFWDWLPVQGDSHSYTDRAIQKGQTYSYRAKFRPELPSNISQVAIPINECTCKEP